MPYSIAEIACLELRNVFSPVRDWGDPDGIRCFFKELGCPIDEVSDQAVNEFKKVVDSLTTLLTKIGKLEEALNHEQPNYIDVGNTIKEIIGGTEELIDKINSLLNQAKELFKEVVTLPGINDLFTRAKDYLVFHYFEQYQPKTFSILFLLGILDYDESGKFRVVHWDRMLSIFTSPISLFENTYQWGVVDKAFLGEKFMDRLYLLMSGFNLTGGRYAMDYNLSRKLGNDDPAELRIPVLRYGTWPPDADGGGYFEFDVNVAPYSRQVSDTESRMEGLFLYPVMIGKMKVEQDMGSDWVLEAKGSLEIGGTSTIGLQISPPFNLSFKSNIFSEVVEPESSVGQGDESEPTPVESTEEVQLWEGEKNNDFLEIAFKRADSDQLRKIFGNEASMFMLGYKNAGVTVRFNLQKDSREFRTEFDIKSLTIILDPSKGDGFLSKLLSSVKLNSETDLAFGISNVEGFYFRGSSALAITIPAHKQIGPVYLDMISIALCISDAIRLETRASFSAELGPIIASVENVGVGLQLSIPGNGGLKVEKPSIIPPTGVGLAIDAPAMSGGGKLYLDSAKGIYFGGVGLMFGNIGLSAIGLIVTKSDNYSLLINIGATFSPGIQLGFGFYLSGVGGLIAVNRSMSIKALQEGIRGGAVSNLLFPDITTVVTNANQLITQYEGIFPVQDGRYVIGPMIEVGWGPMKMISGRVGIFIEVPTPVRVALLGQVKVRFPSYDEALVVINLDILGVVDFDKSELTFQAILIDSYILEFPISGDSAFLLGWGGSPRFALSMGGFHPKYNPPPPAAIFADMKRLKISLGSGDGLDLACESYMALTSNSLQFGANVQVKASAGPLEVYGYLGFDGLFIFSPFSFEVEIRGGVDLSYDGTSLCGVHLYLLLSGPTPWYARGTATIEILFFSFDVGFEFSWGDEEKEVLPAKDPLVELLKELKQPENWGAAQLNRYSLVEFFREADPTSSDNPELLLHPASQLEVRQRVVPLAPPDDTRITKFGYAPVTEHDWFDISGFVINSTPFEGSATENIPDYFAKAQFFDVTKDEQLSMPAFSEYKAGLRVSAEAEVLVSDSCSIKPVEYEMILLDEYGRHQGTSTQKVEWPKLEGKVSGYADKHQYYRQPPDFRYKSKSLMQPVKRVKRQEGYVIVKKNEKGQWDGPVAMADIHKTYKCLPESLSNRKETTYSKGECLEMLQSIRRSTLKRINNLRIVEVWTWNKSHIN